MGDLSLAIPKLRQGSFFPDWLESRRRVEKVLYAAVMEAYTGGISKSGLLNKSKLVAAQWM